MTTLHAALPWGLDQREFVMLCVATLGMLLGTIIMVGWFALGNWRDVQVAKYRAKEAEAKVQEARERRLTESARATLGVMANSPGSRQRNPEYFVASPTSGIFSGALADRGEVPPEIRVNLPKPPPPRVTAAADREAGRTKIDLSPTEEDPRANL